MNVRTLFEDAKVLLEAGRFEGALALVLISIAGTSRKRFPRKPKGKSDREAFTQFLNEENFSIAPCTCMTVQHQGKEVSLAHVLYKVLRNTLLHEAAMPTELSFEESNNWFIRPTKSGYVMSKNWILGLMRAVVLAKENKQLFSDIASNWIPPWSPRSSAPGMKIEGELNIRFLPPETGDK